MYVYSALLHGVCMDAVFFIMSTDAVLCLVLFSFSFTHSIAIQFLLILRALNFKKLYMSKETMSHLNGCPGMIYLLNHRTETKFPVS